MTPQMRVALLRGLYNAGGAFAVVFLTSYALSSNTKQAAITAGLAALSALGFRGVTEGVYDTGRAVRALQGRPGAVHDSDVGAYSPSINAPPTAPPREMTYEDAVQANPVLQHTETSRVLPPHQPPRGEG